MVRNLARFGDSSHRSDGSGAPPKKPTTAQTTFTNGRASSSQRSTPAGARPVLGTSASSLDTVPPPLTMKLSSSDDFLEMAPSRPPIWGRRHTDASASRLSAHAAPLVSPRSSSSTHGKLCDDPITGRLHDGSLLRMFQRRGRGSRLNS